MQYIRLARELEGVYTDLVWLSQTAHQMWRAAYTPAVVAPEVELVACFRDCTPLVHDEPVWATECEYDCEEWVHCCSEPPEALAGGSPRRRAADHTAPSLAEGLQIDSPPPLSGSTSGLSQGEVPELVPKTPMEAQRPLHWILRPHLLEVLYELLLVAR